MTPRIVTVPAGQRRASGDEVATVQVFNQLDDIATHAGLAAIPHALLDVAETHDAERDVARIHIPTQSGTLPTPSYLD